MVQDENEIESEEFVNSAEWCQNVQQNWQEVVQAELDQVASLDTRVHGQVIVPPERKQYFCHKTRSWKYVAADPFISPTVTAPPETLPAYQAMLWTPGKAGVDLRPHIYDKVLKKWVLIDSGSQITAFPPEPGDKEEVGKFLRAVNGSRIKCYGSREISVKIGRKTYPFRAVIADVESPVIGWDFIRCHKVDFIWNAYGDICLRDSRSKITTVLEYKSMPHLKSSRHSKLARIDGSSTSPRRLSGLEAQQLVFQVASIKNLGRELEQVNSADSIPDSKYKDLLLKYPNLLTQNFNEEEPKSAIVHRITINCEKPCKGKVRRLLPGSEKEKKAKEAWFQLARLGIVEKVNPSDCNTWSSSLHFAPKGDGTLRPVGDYRDLNLKTDLDTYSLPHLRDFTNKIAGSRVFSKLDLFKAFHQIVIDKRDRYKTTLATPWGFYQFKRLSMGMRNSAQSFQRWVDSVIGDMEGVFCYLDDLLVYSEDEDTHIKVLEELFQRLDKAGLTVSASKCQFGLPELEYLGYHISSDGISPVKRKIECLEKFPPPTKQKEVLAFLGSLNYYRASLPRLSPEESADTSHPQSRSPASVLDPLYKLATCKMKKSDFKKIWDNSDIIRNAFTDAKTLLTKAVTLNYPVPSAPLALSTDASKTCLGGALEQFVNGAWRPLGLWSKSLKPEQQRYSTYIRELMAVKHAVRHFNNEINGRELIIFTDHKPLIGSWRSPELQGHDPKALNAINEVSQFTSDIRYKPGKDLLVPDMLSRPFGTPMGTAYQLPQEGEGHDPLYVPPEKTMAALEEVSLNAISPQAIAQAQETCPDTLSHRRGQGPANVKMQDININGFKVYCEVSNPQNPRPLVPEEHRSLVINLMHHLDHPNPRETTRRVAKDYYWPCLKKNVESFASTCHPCQAAKPGIPVNPGVGEFPVPDKRFSYVHLDVVGPLPPSQGKRFLLTCLDRTSRWAEAFPMSSASSAECCEAFMQWVSRYGAPCVAVSDNGNSFVSNLFKDIMDTFSIKVNFTPAYHAASNGAIERRHLTIKNSIKAALIDMGNEHQDKWMSVLPWVMLGKRIAVQPDLDTSAAELLMGKSPSIPGQMLGHPGPPLSTVETRALLEELYKKAAKPGLPTSSTPKLIPITKTDGASHVYIKVDTPLGLSPRYEGPYKIISRPSRSQVQVRVGSYVSGLPRLLTVHWSLCKVAKMRDDATEASRPNIGRKPAAKSSKSVQDSDLTTNEENLGSKQTSEETIDIRPVDDGGKIQNEQRQRPVRSTRNSSPCYT